MKTSSAKAKGRRLAAQVRDVLLEYYNVLEPDDIIITSSGEGGSDLMFSPRAKEVIDLDTCECKNQEKWGVPAWIRQAKSHGGRWALFMSKNRDDVYVVQLLEEWLNNR